MASTRKAKKNQTKLFHLFRRSQILQSTCLLYVLPFLIFLSSCAQVRKEPVVKPYVQGFIAALIPSDSKFKQSERIVEIYLPGLKVHLIDKQNRDTIVTVKTDLSGRFNFPPQKKGEYLLCWERGDLEARCHPSVIIVDQRPVHLSTIQFRPEKKREEVVIYGNIRNKENQVPRTHEPLADINSSVKVDVFRQSDIKGDTILGSTFLNNFGDYFIANIPRTDHLRVRATLEKTNNARSIRKEALNLSDSHELDFTLSNHAPILNAVFPNVAGDRVKNANPGDKVELNVSAKDADGDPIQYRWLIMPGNGSLNASTGPNIEWTLPNRKGNYKVTVFAYDEKGGYSKQSTTISTTGRGTKFGGKVNATDAPFVANAEVEINGKTTKTNAAGFFNLYVADAPRYVFNIRKEGYGLLSVIYADGITGVTWKLTPASIQSVDPKNNIDITDDKRDSSRCYIPFSQRINWELYPEQRKPRMQDGKGNTTRQGDVKFHSPLIERIAHLRRQEGCGPGIRVRIPANSLVDDIGNPPPGNVNISLSTIDLLAPFQMPGDYTVIEPGGSTKVMESYGAGSIEIRDGTQSYNLRAGTTAQIIIPVVDIQLLAPGIIPPQIPKLVYDEINGVWKEDGIFTLVGNNYVADVTHFSTLNTDLIKVNQACVQIYSPPTCNAFSGLPDSYNLEVTIPQSPGAAPVVRNFVVDNAVPYHVLYNLPTNTNIILVPYSDDDVPYGTFIVNTGGSQVPSNPNLPAYPYDACQATVTLCNVGAPSPPSDAFLSGLYSFASINLNEPANAGLVAALDGATNDYYAQIDPRDRRTTLADFRSVNNFDGTEANARYVNAADLGFGRDMYGRSDTGTDGNDDIAFYVTNYGEYNTFTELENFTLAVNADPLDVVATVAMEYSRIEDPAVSPGDPIVFGDPDRVIKFFVYNAAGNRINNADLDGAGARPVPQLCMSCHGGSFPAGPVTAPGIPVFNLRDDVKLGSVFLPFDLNGLGIIDGVNPAFNKANQQADVKALNQLVKNSNPGSPIVEVIDEMYSGGAAIQIENFVVTGWSGDPGIEAMYSNVIAPSCRTCHNARPLEDDGLGGTRDIRFHESLQFTDPLELGALPDFRVCNQKVMPHALATFDRFWGSIGPSQPAQFKAFGDVFVPAGYSDACGPSVSAPPLAGFTGIESIFGSSCAFGFCHGGTNPAGLELSPGLAYNELVNEGSIEHPPFDRVEPGDASISWLYHKVNGSQGSFDGSCTNIPEKPNTNCGQQMPPGSSLSVSEIADIQNWIQSGAPN